jgi:rhodanese-related sulfurtransferase
MVHLTAAQANELIALGEIDIIDVREPSEWSDGHLPNARLVPLGELRAAPKASLPKDGVLFVCAAGQRSETAARLAVACGLKNVYNLRGGTRGWVKAGLPVVNEISVAV